MDCLSCGACCTIWDVRLSKEDIDIVPNELTVPIFPLIPMRKDMIKMKNENSRCCALDGVIGERVSCSIYDKRPSACRKFEYGSTGCNEARIRFNLSPV